MIWSEILDINTTPKLRAPPHPTKYPKIQDENVSMISYSNITTVINSSSSDMLLRSRSDATTVEHVLNIKRIFEIYELHSCLYLFQNNTTASKLYNLKDKESSKRGSLAAGMLTFPIKTRRWVAFHNEKRSRSRSRATFGGRLKNK